MNWVQTISRTRGILVVMMIIQLSWLAVIWFTGASSRSDKLLALGIYTLLTGLALTFAPSTLVDNVKTKAILTRYRRHLIGVLFLVALVVGLFYARDQRGWTWDEEFSLEAARIVSGEGIASYFDYYAENPWLGKQHPPLVPMVNGLAMSIFGQHLLVIRLTSLAFAFGTFIITYYLGRELYDSETGALAMIFIMSFPLIFRLGTAGLTDMQVTFFFSLSLLLAFVLIRKPSWRTALFLGLSVGIGMLSKYTMVFILPVLLSFYVASRELRARTRFLVLSGLVSAILFGAWLLFSWRIGILAEQQELVTTLNPTYFVADAEGIKLMANSLLTRLTAALGTYNLPIMLFAALYFLRRRQSSDLFVLLWIALVTLALMFTLPDHRYFMPIFPALAVMMSSWLRLRPTITGRVALLSLLYNAGSLWLFIDWFREAELFVS